MLICGHAKSDQGPRPRNEDAHALAPELGLFAVADGMGGTIGGHIASRLAIQNFIRFHREATDRDGLPADPEGATHRMKDSVGYTCREVGRACVGTLEDMGTTIAAIQVVQNTVVVAHVGDSRVYRYRDGKLRQLTRDHSFVNELERATGFITADVRAAYGHILTRHIGGERAESQPDLMHYDGCPGDYYLICTDGLSDALGNQEISRVFEEHDTSEDLCAHFVKEAWAAGADDNITALVVELKEG